MSRAQDTPSLDQVKTDAQRELAPALQRFPLGRSKIPLRLNTSLKPLSTSIRHWSSEVLTTPSSTPREPSALVETEDASLDVMETVDVPSCSTSTASEPERDEEESCDDVDEDKQNVPQPCHSRFSPSHPVFLFRPYSLTPESRPATPMSSPMSSPTSSPLPMDAFETDWSTSFSPPPTKTVSHMERPPPSVARQLLPSSDTVQGTLKRQYVDMRVIVLMVAVAVGVLGWWSQVCIEQLHASMLPALDQLEANVKNRGIVAAMHKRHFPAASTSHLAVQEHLEHLQRMMQNEIHAWQLVKQAILDDQLVYVVALGDMQAMWTDHTNHSPHSLPPLSDIGQHVRAPTWPSMNASKADWTRLTSLQRQRDQLLGEAPVLHTCCVRDIWMQWIQHDAATSQTIERIIDPPDLPMPDDMSWLVYLSGGGIAGALVGAVVATIITLATDVVVDGRLGACRGWSMIINASFFDSLATITDTVSGGGAGPIAPPPRPTGRVPQHEREMDDDLIFISPSRD
ncbi:hypothetical protein DYB36_013069 [Aphanomyces astaci]|uniref:Transmembrane protein n=1 Tax=Aphanomyces astaci TaxID=112090 RepID=A0A397AU25_APHAT|nr:hypothetical protein DYB36_013069 [Aphanomyces astaci]